MSEAHKYNGGKVILEVGLEYTSVSYKAGDRFLTRIVGTVNNREAFYEDELEALIKNAKEKIDNQREWEQTQRARKLDADRVVEKVLG